MLLYSWDTHQKFFHPFNVAMWLICFGWKQKSLCKSGEWVSTNTTISRYLKQNRLCQIHEPNPSCKICHWNLRWHISDLIDKQDNFEIVAVDDFRFNDILGFIRQTWHACAERETPRVINNIIEMSSRFLRNVPWEWGYESQFWWRYAEYWLFPQHICRRRGSEWPPLL